MEKTKYLKHLAQGKTTKQIAIIMNLSPRTIEYYCEMLRKELGCASSKELIVHYGATVADETSSS